ncbi:hypothetical protein B484DRAFT_484399 [Ochromonadaceae sp. CCMP2298]|nr:hypothetical protein B484DRAFT_484399 [Ochromonadaceae sp. CCMP2298]
MKLVNLTVQCDDVLLLCSVIAMQKSLYVWLGVNGAAPCLQTLVTAMQTRFGVPTSCLIGVGEEKGVAMAARLARRLEVQVLVSDSLPDLPPEHLLQLEQRLLAELLLIYAGGEMKGMGMGIGAGGKAGARGENGLGAEGAEGAEGGSGAEAGAEGGGAEGAESEGNDFFPTAAAASDTALASAALLAAALAEPTC